MKSINRVKLIVAIHDILQIHLSVGFISMISCNVLISSISCRY